MPEFSLVLPIGGAEIVVQIELDEPPEIGERIEIEGHGPYVVVKVSEHPDDVTKSDGSIIMAPIVPADPTESARS